MKHLKVLHVARHAKSSWDNDGIADIDRTLKSRGIKNAYEISRKLKLNNLIPERIISSPANRALHTAIIFARVFEFPLAKLEINDSLYESRTEDIVDIIRELDDRCNSVMIFAHNPDVTDLVNKFIKIPVDNIPTSGVVTLTFSAHEWSGIDRKNLENQELNFPKSDE